MCVTVLPVGWSLGGEISKLKKIKNGGDPVH